MCLCGPLLQKLMWQLVAWCFVHILPFHWEECKRWAEKEPFDFCYYRLTKYSFVSSDVMLTTSVSHLSSGCSVCHMGWGVPKPKWVDSIQSQALPDNHPHCSINVRVSRDKSCSLQGLPFSFVNRIFWVIHVLSSVSWTFFAWTMLSQIPAPRRSPARASGHLDSEKAIGNLW